jgi:chromosome segregation ATPase
MNYNALTTSLAVYKDKQQALKDDIKRFTEDADEIAAKISSMLDQGDAYTAHLKHLRSVKICSIAEYKDSVRLLFITTNKVTAYQSNLFAVQFSLSQATAELEELEAEIVQIQNKLKKFGRLVNFVQP